MLDAAKAGGLGPDRSDGRLHVDRHDRLDVLELETDRGEGCSELMGGVAEKVPLCFEQFLLPCLWSR